MINVDVYVPSLDQNLDFELDETVHISQIIGELKDILSKKTRQEGTSGTADFTLCLLRQKRVLPMQMTLETCGVKNGDRLLLV